MGLDLRKWEWDHRLGVEDRHCCVRQKGGSCADESGGVADGGSIVMWILDWMGRLTSINTYPGMSRRQPFHSPILENLGMRRRWSKVIEVA